MKFSIKSLPALLLLLCPPFAHSAGGFTIGDSQIVGFSGDGAAEGVVAGQAVEESSPNGNWSQHSALGWVFNTYNGWQYAYSQGTWFWIDGQWGWTEDEGWHWLGETDWVYRINDAVWYEPRYL